MVVRLLVVGCALLQPPVAYSPLPHGYAAHYKPGLMETVAENRGLKPAACMVASPLGHPIGSWLTVYSYRSKTSEKCKVVDVCHPADCRGIRQRGIVIELGWPAARRLCLISRYAQEPPSYCQVRLMFSGQ